MPKSVRSLQRNGLFRQCKDGLLVNPV
jgi:hypothetical protein